VVCKRDKPGQETHGKGWEASGSPAYGTGLTERHLLVVSATPESGVVVRGLQQKATDLFCDGVVHGADMRNV
jgi:hypothetical protein